MNYAEMFAKAHPKAVDFLESEYLKNRAEADDAAAKAGYRMAGFRLGRAVFTSKEVKEKQQDTPQRGGSA